MKRLGSLLFISLFIFLSVQAEVLNKTYSITATHAKAVRVENSFGNIRLQHWTKNSAEISVIVTVIAASEARAKEIMEHISITQEEKGEWLSSVTTTENMNTRNKEKVEIACIVSLPPFYPIELSQKFGTINMPSTAVEASAKVSVHFGKLVGGNFARDLELEGAHSNLSLDRAVDADLDIQFCKPFKAGTLGKATLEGKHSGLEIGSAEQIEGEIEFSDMKITSLGELQLEAQHSNLEIEEVKKSLDIPSLSFSNITIKKLNQNFSSISIPKAQHSNIKMTLIGTPSIRMENNHDKFSSVKTSDEIKSRITNNSSAPLIRFGGSFSTLKIN